MQRWPLTGRTDELAVIAEALSDAHGSVGVVITGAAGVGKTRLAQEAAKAATAKGWTVRWLAGTVAAQSVPLGAFARWADRLDGHPLQLVGSVLAAVTESDDGVPVLVCVDDAHRLDHLSAFTLHQLVLRKSARVIVTIRAGEPVTDAVTALWKDCHLRRLDVEPLSRRHIDALLESVLGGRVATDEVARLWQLTRGNVLFLQEIVNHDRDDGRLVLLDGQWVRTGPMDFSAALVELVSLQLGRATPAVLDVIDLVTLAEPLESVYLAALTDPQAMEDAERRGLIVVLPGASGDLVRLGHPLFGEVRLAGGGRWRLARLRGRLVQGMTSSRSPAEPPDPVRLALLRQNSDLPPDAGQLVAAAHAALTRMDLMLTARFAEAAMEAGSGVDAKLILAQTHSLMSRGEDAERLLASLATQRLPDAAWITMMSLRAANLLWSLGRPEDSFAVVDEALTASSPSRTPSLLAFRSVQLAVAGQPVEALHTADAVDSHHLHPLPAMMRTWALTIAHGDVGGVDKATEAAHEGAALAAESPEVAFQAGGLAIYFADALVLAGDLTTAAALADDIDVQLTDVPGAARTNVMALKGFTALANGDARTAIDRLDAAMSEYARNESKVGTEYFFGVAYVQALAVTGEAGKAAAHLATIHRNGHRALGFLEPSLRLAAAWTAAARGHLSQARSITAGAVELARARGQYAREVSCLQAAIQFGETQHAARLADLATLVAGPRTKLVARWAAAAADEDGDELLSTSVDLGMMGDRIAAADAAAQASLVFAQRSRRGAALTAASRAASIIADCAAVTPATRAAAMPLPLSEREREIALLVSDGRSNKDIAAATNVSIRTVEGHVYQACRKLGVANRTELARVLDPFTEGRGVNPG